MTIVCKIQQQKSGVKKKIQTSNRLIEHTTDIAFGILNAGQRMRVQIY